MSPSRILKNLLLALALVAVALTIPSQNIDTPAAALTLFLTLAIVLLTMANFFLTRNKPSRHTAPATTAKFLNTQTSAFDKRWFEAIFDNPAALLVSTFFLTATTGGLLLTLSPFAAHGQKLALIDTLFTAFSATCVTGLVVLDTAQDFSFAGQLLILIMIQIGGLGIMTFSAAVFTLMGRRMSLRHETAIAELLSNEDRSEIHQTTRRIFRITFTVEAIGAALLAILFFIHGDRPLQAIWRGIFTAISAFCNAGFGIQSDNLIPYQHNPLILYTISLIIILGGLGPIVISALPRLRNPRRLSLHVSISLLTTAFLLVVPAIFATIVEWSNSLAHLNTADRLANGWFQIVTTRTAGFNSVDLTDLRPATILVMLILMFIGGSPASTAGGIKTTTFALLLLVVYAALRGREKVLIFGYQIPTASIFKATAVVTMGVLSVIGATLLLLMTQQMDLVTTLFEVVSALGTVGLTIGGTPQLDSVGKIIIALCMLAGRVGPLTLFVLLTTRAPRDDWERPEHPLIVG